MDNYCFTGKVTRIICGNTGYIFKFLGDLNKTENNATWYVAEKHNGNNLISVNKDRFFSASKDISDFIVMNKDEKLTIFFEYDEKTGQPDGTESNPFKITKAELRYD